MALCWIAAGMARQPPSSAASTARCTCPPYGPPSTRPSPLSHRPRRTPPDQLLTAAKVPRQAGQPLSETAPRESPSRATFSETTSWTPSQRIWSAAGQRRAAGPSPMRRDTCLTEVAREWPSVRGGVHGGCRAVWDHRCRRAAVDRPPCRPWQPVRTRVEHPGRHGRWVIAAVTVPTGPRTTGPLAASPLTVARSLHD
jgi:hypothetical protein